MLKAEKTVVQTTICPINSASAPISWDMGTLETATGVQKHATKVANCAPVKFVRLRELRRIAQEIPINGTIITLLIVAKIICFLRAGMDENSNLAPSTKRERGVATLERLESVL